MKRLKTILILGVLLAGMGCSNVYSMRLFRMCRLSNKKLEKVNSKPDLPDLNIVGSDGLTQLNRALKDNKFDRARLLLSQGADPSIARDELQWTALHWAVFKGQDALVAAIMKTHRQLMHVPDTDEKTPVMLVADRRAHIQKMLGINMIGRDTFDLDNDSIARMLSFFTGESSGSNDKTSR